MARPVVIVGGGVAGLSCALELECAGVPYTLLEADGRFGGKVRTDTVDGFKLDHGYQVDFTAYPNLNSVAPPDDLDLGFFAQGAALRDRTGIHLVEEPKGLPALMRMAFERSVSMKDKLLVRKWTGAIKSKNVESLREMPDMSTERHLQEFGFSDEFITKFMRPFLGGVFADRSLGFSRQQFAWVWKMLSEGKVGLPEDGMEAIPKLILSQLAPQNVRLYARVRELLYTASGDVSGVVLETHERIEAGAIVLACSPAEASRLLGDEIPAAYRSFTTLWFAAGSYPVEKPYLLLNSTGDGMVNLLIPSSLAQPSYAPRGRQLVGAMVLGVPKEDDDRLVEKVQADLDRTMPEVGAGLWKPLRVDRIAKAHLVEAPGFAANRPKPETRIPGVLLAGEVTTNASLDGAAESGLRAARRAMALMQVQELVLA